MTDSSSRRYRKRKRAEAEEETRRRITEAAVELHGTVGPAETTITEVADLAGVSRMTVYNHFPDPVDLFEACSSHWAARNPFPDPSTWRAADPSERLVLGLRELYAWYALKQDMLGNVLRDMPNVPALAEVMGGLWEPYMEGIVGVLAEGWSDPDVSSPALRAVLRLAVDFQSWRILTDSGLEDGVAAQVVARMVAGVVRAGEGPRDPDLQNRTRSPR